MGSRPSLGRWLEFIDVIVIAAWFVVLFLATAAQDEARTVEEFLAIRFSVANLIIFTLLLAIWHLSLRQCGLYDSSPSRRTEQNVSAILKGATLGIGGWLLVGLVFDLSFVQAKFLLQLWCGGAVLVVVTRLLTRLLLRRRKNAERYLQRLLIVGLNPRAIRIARELEQHPERGYRVLGFADEPSMAMGCYPLACEFDDLPEYLRHTAVDEVIVCLPLRSRYHRVIEAVDACEEQGITVRVVADLLPVGTSHSTVEQFGDTALISMHPHRISDAGARTKRLMDIVASGLLLLILAPFLLLISVLITLDSDGPVLFSQERLGLNKKTFRMLKFRTMVKDATDRQAELEHLNEVDGPAFKIKDDPRITGFGQFLRRTSIDELPQLINVLRGEMSLVGPRPLPVRDYEGFSVDWHRRRFSVRPGISGLWQVAGRSNLPFDEWMALDLKYINEWSLALDVKVLLKTVPAVLRGTGAT